MNQPSFLPANAIQQAAKLSCYLDRCQANGQQPDPKYVREYQSIINAAEARLTPDQLAYAQNQMQREKINVQGAIHAEQQKIAAYEQKKEHNTRAAGLALALRDSTKNMSTGAISNPADLHKISRGETITQSSGKSRLPKAALAQQVKKKFGTSLTEHQRRLDDCCQMTDPIKRDAQIKQYGFDKKTVENWADGGGLIFGLQERMAERDKDMPDTVDVEPSQRDVLRADLMKGFLDQGVGEASPFDEREEWMAAPGNRLQEDSMAGDISRAWAVSEEVEEEAVVESTAQTL